MSLVAIVVVAVVLAVAGRLVRLAVRIALLIALIALLASYGTHAARRGRAVALPGNPPRPSLTSAAQR